MADAEFSIDATIYCDDVRREVGGRLILIGVYVTDFLVEKFPASISMLVSIQGDVVSAGTAATSLFIEDENGGVLFDSPPTPPAEFFEGRFVLGHHFEITAHKETTLYVSVRNGANTYSLPTRRVKLIASAMAERGLAT